MTSSNFIQHANLDIQTLGTTDLLVPDPVLKTPEHSVKHQLLAFELPQVVAPVGTLPEHRTCTKRKVIMVSGKLTNKSRTILQVRVSTKQVICEIFTLTYERTTKMIDIYDG